MPRLLTLVVLALALVSTQVEAQSRRIHVTVEIVQQTFTGDLTDPKIGDRISSSVLLRDGNDVVGTGAGTCTIVSVPEPPAVEDTLLQCLLTVVFDKKDQLSFGGVAPVPEAGVIAHFGIFGGTGDFRTARGEVTLTVISLVLQDAVFEIE
jgi:hypothetical protein